MDFSPILNFFNYLILFVMLIIASITDFKSRTISNKLIAFAFITGLAIKILAFDFWVLADSVLGLAIAGGTFLLISYALKDGIGYGDIKLFACVGMFLGMRLSFSAMLFSVFAGAVVGLVMLFSKRFHLDSTMPFAPMILLGVILALAMK